jgi:hypothetical protein
VVLAGSARVICDKPPLKRTDLVPECALVAFINAEYWPEVVLVAFLLYPRRLSQPAGCKLTAVDSKSSKKITSAETLLATDELLITDEDTTELEDLILELVTALVDITELEDLTLELVTALVDATELEDFTLELTTAPLKPLLIYAATSSAQTPVHLVGTPI